MLQEVGSCVATPAPPTDPRYGVCAGRCPVLILSERTRLPADRVKELERTIDLLDGQLPPLKNFILPSGGLPAASLHCARSVRL